MKYQLILGAFFSFFLMGINCLVSGKFNNIEIEIIHEVEGEMVKIPSTGKLGYAYPGYAAIQPRFIKHIEELQEGKVLEIGAGPGNTYQKIPDAPLSEKPSVTYVLNEIDPEFQKEIRKLQKKGSICPVLSKKECLQHLQSCPEATYDTIFSGMVFHFFNPEVYLKTLLESHRTLKEGGILYVTQNPYCYPEDDSGMIDFRKNIKKGRLFPGYYISKETAALDWMTTYAYTALSENQSEEHISQINDVFLACLKNPKNQPKMPLLNYHTAGSLSTLLEKCGFDVIEAGNYMDRYTNGGILPYVGAIAQKKILDQPTLDQLIKEAKELTDTVERDYQPPYATSNTVLLVPQRINSIRQKLK